MARSDCDRCFSRKHPVLIDYYGNVAGDVGVIAELAKYVRTPSCDRTVRTQYQIKCETCSDGPNESTRKHATLVNEHRNGAVAVGDVRVSEQVSVRAGTVV